MGTLPEKLASPKYQIVYLSDRSHLTDKALVGFWSQIL